MKRSSLNARMRNAEALFAAQGFRPPPWASWTPADWRGAPERARFCTEH